MADYIYSMETRLSPDQQRAVTIVQEAARAHEMNVYVSGGTIRDLVTGFAIRDLDFTVQGNTLKLQKDLEKAGAVIQGTDEDLKILYVQFPGNVRAEISMARSETFEKPGKATIQPSTITDDLRRRDFTVNAMALSLNEGSRGLLLDPTNGAADIEGKAIRILHNYAFLDDPSRLIRATRFMARFEWPLEDRTQARFAAAKENEYIQYISSRAIGNEIEALIYEEDPIKVMRALEKEGWLDVLHPKFALNKIDVQGLTHVTKLRQQMNDVAMNPDVGPIVLYYLTKKFSDKEIADLRRILPRKDTVTAWKNLEDDAKALARQLSGKEAASASGAWKMITAARPELVMFLMLTSKQTAVTQKLHNYFGKWQQVKTRLPFPEMAELRITPALPEYNQIMQEAFLLLLDGKLRNPTEILKFLKPFEPPPPPPPPPAPGRGRRKAGVKGKPGRPPRPKVEDEEVDEEKEAADAADGDLDEEELELDLDERDEEEAEHDDDEGDDEDEERPAKRGRAPAKAPAPMATAPAKGAPAKPATTPPPPAPAKHAPAKTAAKGTLATVAEKVGGALGAAVKAAVASPVKQAATPAKTASKAPQKTAAKTPAKSPVKATAQAPAKAPAKAAPQKHPAKAPAKAPAKKTAPAKNQPAKRAPAKASKRR
jgi:tRNA nucleotidyltransferase (CCA-adding enzyme)